MLAGVRGHRCHFAAFIQAACLLTQPLAEEQRGRVVPRVSSKCCVTTPMAHPTQIYRIQSWGRTKQEDTCCHQCPALPVQGPTLEAQGGGPRGAGTVTFATLCAGAVNTGRPTGLNEGICRGPRWLPPPPSGPCSHSLRDVSLGQHLKYPEDNEGGSVLPLGPTGPGGGSGGGETCTQTAECNGWLSCSWSSSQEITADVLEGLELWGEGSISQPSLALTHAGP